MALMILVRWFQKDAESDDEAEIALVKLMPRDDARGRNRHALNLVERSRRKRRLLPDVVQFLKTCTKRVVLTGGLVTGTVIITLIGSVYGLGSGFDEATVSYARSAKQGQPVSNTEAGKYRGFEAGEGLFGGTRNSSSSSVSHALSLESLTKASIYLEDSIDHVKGIIRSSRKFPQSFLSETFYEPAGCMKPLVEQLEVIGADWETDTRTLQMLSHAAELFGAELDPKELAIKKESMLSGYISLQIGFKGNALTIPLTRPGSKHVLYDEVDPLVTALRVAGFAAWFQDADKPKDVHIYAIPIGNPDLSKSEAALVYGDHGYFQGYAGTVAGEPRKDPHGGPIVCRWMVEAGYGIDWRWANAGRVGSPTGDWRERLRAVAQRYVTTSDKQAFSLARQLGYLGGSYEDPSNMCGPLTAAILLEADLIPASVGPLRDPKSFWLANPQLNGRPWSFFSADEYELFRSPMSLDSFDFKARPLCPGDTVFTYAGIGEFSHVFVVTEIDAQGRAYSVTNYGQEDGSFLVERLMLYDPAEPKEGVFKNEWSNDVTRGRTGLGGFEVLRRRGSCLQPGTPLKYSVRPGDTFATLAARFHTSIPTILDANQFSHETLKLEVGQELLILVNTLDEFASKDEASVLNERSSGCDASRELECTLRF